MSASPEPVQRVLEALAIRHVLHRPPGGGVYASFRVWIAPEEAVQFRMLRWGSSLVIRAVELARVESPGTEALWTINEFNRSWGIGRVYHSAEQSTWNAGLGVPLHDEEPDSREVAVAIEALCEVGRALRADVGGYAGMDRGLRDALWSAYSPATLSLPVLGLALRRADLPFELRLDGDLLVQRFSSEGRRDFLVDLQLVDQRFLFARGRFDHAIRVPADRVTLEALQRVNAGLSLGTAVLHRESGEPWFLVGLPLTWTAATPTLVKTLVDHCADATAAIERKLLHRSVRS